ncbi:MAG: Ig-like domain-containing protein [Alphaproteobacteria bacterium]|nr:Ig-like domain-containing protein [Alphaproteobacteria bacterium]MDD9920098.1 Ig-like domain-containing protein [Alphaproteobacteria bacterium]
MAEIINTVSNTSVAVETKNIAVRVPEQGGLLAYLVSPGTQIDLSAIDFDQSMLEMDDGNLRITLPNDQGEILLLDISIASSSETEEAPTLLFSDGSTIHTDALLQALAAAEQAENFNSIEPAAGPQAAPISQVQDTSPENNGFTVPGIVGDGFGDNSSVISEVIGPFTIAPAFDEIDTDEILEPAFASALAPSNPDAIDDVRSTLRDTPITIDVLTNDIDPEGDPLSITSATSPTNGTITINTGGTITYTPSTGFSGTDTFTYTITDGTNFDTATVTVNVTNTAPDAVNDSTTTAYNTPVIITVLTNDTDPEGDPLSITGTTSPSNGTIVVNAGSTITYTPNTGFSGTDTFTYTITDGHGGTDTATVTVVVDNAPPAANNDTATTHCGTAVTVDVLANDTDPNGDTLTVTGIASAPTNGTAIVNASGTITYTPTGTFTGTDTFTYTITDGNGGTDTATVTVTVTNTAPDAVNDAVSTAYNTPILIEVLKNDTDADSDTISITGTTTPSNGTIVVNASGTITYTPNTGFSGTDTFTYTIDDGCGATDTATVTVVVDNAPPAANNDTATTHCGTAVTVDVLANDTDPNGDTLTVTGIASAPANGTAVVNASGTITYTPTGTFTGTDTFTYSISDGNGGTDTATVTVTVTNTAPDAVNDTATTAHDTPVIISVLTNDTDADGDTISITGTTNPSNGTIVVNAGGTITYTPNASFIGTDTFTYTIDDGCGATDTATVTVTVTNTAPDAVDDTVSTAHNTPILIEVLKNDTDPESDPLSVTSTTSPSNGTIVVNASGTITYTPNTGYTGTDTFTYTISDGHGGTDTATVTVTIAAPPNTPPVANNDSVTAHCGDTVTISVLANDSDANGDTLTVTGIASAPSRGTASINSNGTITYTPSSHFVGTDTFTYTISDGNGGTDTATVTVNFTNTAPDAADDFISAGVGGSWVTFNVLSNDSDPDGDAISVTGFSNVANGTVENLGGGSFRAFRTDAGTVTFDYTIQDDCGATDTASVRVNFTAPPIIGGGCPLELDLDGDGLNLIPLAESDAFFDLDGDGVAEHTAWTGTREGILSIDRNGDGIINGIDEVFGNTGIDGFTELAQREDSNQDGRIDANDVRFSELRIWLDADSDGYSDDGELFNLSDFGITAINLEADFIDETVSEQWVSHKGTFEYSNGATGDIYSVWYDYEEVTESDVLTYNSPSSEDSALDDMFTADTSNDIGLGDVSGIDSLAGLGLDYQPNQDYS